MINTCFCYLEQVLKIFQKDFQTVKIFTDLKKKMCCARKQSVIRKMRNKSLMRTGCGNVLKFVNVSQDAWHLASMDFLVLLLILQHRDAIHAAGSYMLMFKVNNKDTRTTPGKCRLSNGFNRVERTERKMK